MKTDWDKFDKEFENFDKEFDTPFFRDPKGYMKKQRNRMIIFVLALFVLVSAAYFAMINKAHSQGKTFYTIEVMSYGGSHFFQSDSIISQTPNNIKFIDIYGRVQMVTGENIVVTGY